MSRTEPASARTIALVLIPVLLIILAGCSLDDALETTFEGQLVDADGAPVADAVVFAPEGAASAAQRANVRESCHAPSEASRAATCTDAEGRFALRLTTPLVGTQRLVFEWRYWHTVAEIDLALRGPGQSIDVDARFPSLEPAEELERAVQYVLPGLKRFELITLNTEKAIIALQDHTAAVDADLEPVYLNLPILQPDGTQQFITWTAYHHDMRELGVSDCAIDAATFVPVDCQEVSGPSLTFQGMPWLGANDILQMIGETEKNLEALRDESVYQFSVIAVIGDELDATYYGTQLTAPHTPSSLQGLRSVLDLHYDAATTQRLLDSNQANYLLYNQIDVDVPSEDEDSHLHAQALAPTAHRDALGRSDHMLEDGVKFLRPVMIADATVYDAVAGVRLVTNYFARVDAMANRQDLIFALLQLSAKEAPSNLTSLTQWSNAFTVRTRIGGYRRFTAAGQEAFTWPAGPCVESDNLLQAYRDSSRDSTTLDNEYWVWWTNTTRYPGTSGCAGIGGFGRTPRQGGTTWVSLRNASNEITSSTLMHETGHLLNARHANGTNPHQCRLIGILPVGPNGPSLMITGVNRSTRTTCFAITESGDTSLRSRTLAAEHLHPLLR
ncbi:hypothetical protein BH23DEI1_BH23DEI1_17790 [soil metagenome]